MQQRPNIVFYFSDQQRWDTLGCYGQRLDVTPNLDALAAGGTRYENAFTCQPVCGPARACLQTGRYATEIGCEINGFALPFGRVKTLAQCFNEAGYATGYVGKWHLATDRLAGIDYEQSAIPAERRGGYKDCWMAADVLEFTSQGYNGYVYNADNERVPFVGYRADCINNFAIDFLHGRKEQVEPFFLFISQIEPHHQNDRRRYEGPDGSRAQFADFQPPGDLAACSRACAQGTDVSNWRENYPDYLGCCHSLDYNVGRLVDTLKKQGMWENTILVYTADHGSHFLTRGREAEYKRTCHDASIHIPLIITGPGFTGGNVVRNVVSLLDVSATLLACAGIERPEGWRGRDLRPLAAGRTEGWEDVAFLQISESRVGRAIRTPDYTYAVRAEGDGYRVFASDVYYEEFFYVLKDDPFQQNNLAADSAWAETRAHLAELLQCKMVQAGERPPEIRPFRAW